MNIARGNNNDVVILKSVGLMKLVHLSLEISRQNFLTEIIIGGNQCEKYHMLPEA